MEAERSPPLRSVLLSAAILGASDRGRGGWAAALLVFAGTLVLALPRVLARWGMLPDAVEYMGIAWSWVHGRGFVDPVAYSYYLPGTPPVPALAMRAPVLPLLLAGPLALGVGAHGVLVAHTLLAAAVGAAGVGLARRLAPAAGLAFGIGFAWSFGWIVAVENLITEAAAVAALLALAALAPAALRSKRAGAAFGALLFAAWLTRPNLALVAPAFAGAAALVLGPRRALRCAPLWIALVTFAALQQCFSRSVVQITGFAPYEHYKVLLETTGAVDAAYYQKTYVGWLRYLEANRTRVAAALALNARELLRLLFLAPDFHYVGWLAPAALAHAFRRRDEKRFQRILLALAALLLLAFVAIGWGAIDPRRLALPAVACLWLLAADWLADLAARRMRGGAPRWAGAAPALVPLALFALSPSATGMLRESARAWTAYRRLGTRTGLEGSASAHFCAAMDRDALVASPDPWSVYLVCGNAGWVLPLDLDDETWLARYLGERVPGYLIADPARAARLDASPRLERVDAAGDRVLYRVKDAGPGSRPWSAPPPIAPPPSSPPRQGNRLDHPASARGAGARSEPEASEVNRRAAAQQPNRPQADARSEPEASEVNRRAAAQQPNRPQADARIERSERSQQLTEYTVVWA